MNHLMYKRQSESELQELKEGRGQTVSEIEAFMNENSGSLGEEYLEKTTTRLTWTEAMYRFLTCKEP